MMEVRDRAMPLKFHKLLILDPERAGRLEEW
jgi:hypothetical protein